MASSAQISFAFIAKDAASQSIRNISNNIKNLGDVAGKVGGAIKTAFKVAFAAVTGALTAATFAIYKFTKAAIADDAEQQKLIATLKARGLSTEVATKRINEMIAAGQKLAFTDSEVREGFATATQFAKGYAKQQAILSAAQNLARAKNISLARATSIVGKAFAGNGKGLKAYGIELQKTIHWTETKIGKDQLGNRTEQKTAKTRKETIKGMQAVNMVNAQFAGVADAYAKTFAGQFDQVRDSINETTEAIGYAIGGGEGLPTFTRLLEGIRPVLDDLIGEINKNLPKIQTFTRRLVDQFLAKLPGLVASVKRELPILIDKATQFIGSVANFGRDLVSFLGPDGLVTAGIFGLGAKMGGLGGGLGATFAAEFIKRGVDPITASITGSIAGAITAGIVQGFASAAAQAAVAKFLGLFKNVTVSPTVPLPIPGKGPGKGVGTGILDTLSKTGPLALLGKLGATAIVSVGAALAIAEGIKFTKEDQKFYNKAGAAGFDPATGFRIGDDVKKGVIDGMRDSRPPSVNLSNTTTLKLDGKVVAQSVSKYLAGNYSAATGTRVGGR